MNNPVLQQLAAALTENNTAQIWAITEKHGFGDVVFIPDKKDRSVVGTAALWALAQHTNNQDIAAQLVAWCIRHYVAEKPHRHPAPQHLSGLITQALLLNAPQYIVDWAKDIRDCFVAHGQKKMFRQNMHDVVSEINAVLCNTVPKTIGFTQSHQEMWRNWAQWQTQYLFVHMPQDLLIGDEKSWDNGAWKQCMDLVPLSSPHAAALAIRILDINVEEKQGDPAPVPIQTHQKIWEALSMQCTVEHILDLLNPKKSCLADKNAWGWLQKALRKEPDKNISQQCLQRTVATLFDAMMGIWRAQEGYMDVQKLPHHHRAFLSTLATRYDVGLMPHVHSILDVLAMSEVAVPSNRVKSTKRM